MYRRIIIQMPCKPKISRLQRFQTYSDRSNIVLGTSWYIPVKTDVGTCIMPSLKNVDQLYTSIRWFSGDFWDISLVLMQLHSASGSATYDVQGALSDQDVYLWWNTCVSKGRSRRCTRHNAVCAQLVLTQAPSKMKILEERVSFIFGTAQR